jgi:hypothetical protein
VLYPLLVLAVVLVSANHFWLDAVGGAAAAALGVRLSGLRARARATAWDGRTCRRDRLGRVGPI